MFYNNITPFLKWPGGKRWLARLIVDNFKTFNGNYYEPFLGSGAIYFALLPNKAYLSDINRELIVLFKEMRDHPDELAKEMKKHQKKHSQEYYYEIRNKHFRSDIRIAARFLYLNRTCYNGMYRVNKKGRFNVPIGSKTDCTYDLDHFKQYSDVLKNAEISESDFEDAIKNAQNGDLIFADPPYVMKNSSQFSKYNDTLFTWKDQQRLINALNNAKNRGAEIVVTNASCDEIKKMYLEAGYYVYNLTRICTISSNSSKRSKINELLITSFKLDNMEKYRCQI